MWKNCISCLFFLYFLIFSGCKGIVLFRKMGDFAYQFRLFWFAIWANLVCNLGEIAEAYCAKYMFVRHFRCFISVRKR